MNHSRRTKTYIIIHCPTGKILASKVKVAESIVERTIGLLNRTALEEGEGLLLKPCYSIHTFFMKFNIDVLFIDRDNRIKKIVQNLKKWRLSRCVEAESTLELNAMSLNIEGIKTGDKIEFKNVQ